MSVNNRKCSDTGAVALSGGTYGSKKHREKCASPALVSAPKSERGTYTDGLHSKGTLHAENYKKWRGSFAKT